VISIKEAAEYAMAFARATLGPERTADVRLEEIESTTVGDGAWRITLSFTPPGAPTLAETFGPRKREYKTFTVRKADGEVTSMKIRELADA
jgi:hypothetical protein